MRRVGLLGGTFDPPHTGHLVVAECARVELELDEVRLLVAGDPWMKRTEAATHERIELARAAVDGQPGLEVDDRETRRSGPTYTADTLEELQRMESDVAWVFLLGTDAAARLDEWGRAADAVALAQFVVVSRPGHGVPTGSRLASRLDRLEVPEMAISSTDLRARYRDGRATRFQVPAAVDDLIRRRRLYREG